MNVPSFPLHWPPGWERFKGYRKASGFRRSSATYATSRLTIRDALDRLLPELEKLGADDVTISTNVRPHLYGQMGDCADPGAAVYFTIEDAPTALACDRWDRTADNLAAIAAHVAALRGQERWGVGTVAQALAGYKALPAAPAARSWWDVLGVAPTADVETIKRRRRELLSDLHPDRPGGDQDRAADVNAAYQAAMAERNAS